MIRMTPTYAIHLDHFESCSVEDHDETSRFAVRFHRPSLGSEAFWVEVEDDVDREKFANRLLRILFGAPISEQYASTTPATRLHRDKKPLTYVFDSIVDVTHR